MLINYIVSFFLFNNRLLTTSIKKGDVYLISNEQVHYFQNIEKTKGKIILFTNAFLENDLLIEQVFEQNINNPIFRLR